MNEHITSERAAAGGDAPSEHKRHRLTASRLDLAAACSGSHSIEWTRDTSEAARNGTAGHSFLERAVAGDVVGALEVLPEHLKGRMSAVDVQSLGSLFPATPLLEVPVAYDPETDSARILEGAGHRDYGSVRPGELPGTIDAFGHADGEGVVVDWKLGAGFVAHPRDNLQVQFAGVVVSRLYGLTSVRGAIVKIDEGGEAAVYRATWDEIDLDAIAAKLRRVHASLSKPAFVVGEHCRWCPGRWHCPEMAAQGQALVELAERRGELTDEAFARTWRAIRAVKPLMEDMEKVLRARVMESPLSLGDGKQVRIVESIRHTPKLLAVVEAAVEVGVDPADVIAAGTVSRAGLVKQVGEEKTAALLAEVEKENGMSTTVISSMREVRER